MGISPTATWADDREDWRRYRPSPPAKAPVCACASDRSARTDAWRDLCQRYYFHQDARAKRVLDHFEACKLDELAIDAADDEDAEFARLVAFLGLRKCAQSEHAQVFADNLEELERVKNHVRGEYHAFRADSQYQDFDARVNEVQSTNYELQRDASDGRDRLALRVQKTYVRSSSNQALMEKNAEAFVTTHLPNVGAHPFLAGLAEVLRWNLESSTVVGWQLSDAVFVESGGITFSGAALSFLVGALNFGHVALPPAASVASDATATGAHVTNVRSRVWFLDAYMSDQDIRQLLRLLPSPRKLEGRPTGTKHTSEIYRMNTHGTHDEPRRFFERWCVLL
ncbi:hypothetical protein PybrP1_006368 [[Pythium] brassicae (nom. inval.)]|nr:hypothetical protein PybrP1_006368 [[Pythium] brassicae (nom. inval.)]